MTPADARFPSGIFAEALTPPPNDALALWLDPTEASPLDDETLSRLRSMGIDIEAITTPWCVSWTHVNFESSGNRYVPMATGEPALIFGVIDDGLIDLVAWHPMSGRIGTRLGIGACLGQGQIGRDGCGYTGRPLLVWRSPIEWLRHHRCGLVIADWAAAAHLLAGVILLPEDGGFGIEIVRRLRLPSPVIVKQRREPLVA
jgi:hypothetical protein